jgi:hypothetical protein
VVLTAAEWDWIPVGFTTCFHTLGFMLNTAVSPTQGPHKLIRIHVLHRLVWVQKIIIPQEIIEGVPEMLSSL